MTFISCLIIPHTLHKTAGRRVRSLEVAGAQGGSSRLPLSGSGTVFWSPLKSSSGGAIAGITSNANVLGRLSRCFRFLSPVKPMRMGQKNTTPRSKTWLRPVINFLIKVADIGTKESKVFKGLYCKWITFVRRCSWKCLTVGTVTCSHAPSCRYASILKVEWQIQLNKKYLLTMCAPVKFKINE